MEPSRGYHVFLISFLQYDIVIWFMVAIETISTIGTVCAAFTDRWVLLTESFTVQYFDFFTSYK